MTDERSREFSEANVVPSAKAGKRQIIYKIGDDDEWREWLIITNDVIMNKSFIKQSISLKLNLFILHSKGIS